VKLTAERFPRLSVVTAVREDGALYLGPIASRRVADRFVDAVHDVVPLRRCATRLRAAQDHPTCALKDLGRCGSPCDGTQTAADYTAVVAGFRNIVEGDATPLLGALRRRMDELARVGRYEHARDARSRLHTTATVLATTHRTGRLAAIRELVVRRPAGPEHEVVLVRYGRLAASTRVPAAASDDDARDALVLAGESRVGSGLPGRNDAEEVRLVLGWLDRPGTRIVTVGDTYAEPWGGGATLAGTVAEARAVSRALRRDRQLLQGAKVRRRTA
jgi:DNA polymerase-3 subunit epsilon